MIEQQTISPSKAALKPGFVTGLIMLVITFLIYFIDYTYLVSAWYGFASLVIFFGLVIYFGKQYRKELGGFMTFGTAFQFAFVTLIIAGLIAMVGNILLYHVIHPGLSEMLVKVQLENMMEMLDNFGAGESLSSDQIKDMRRDMEDAYTFVGQIKSFGIALIIYAILSLILGAVIKKRDKSTDF
ncbi:DUF4199 domain-containing protein [Cyclobacterium qasimii]|uniref:DUF4199 domain-containing protein n=2 Tax=Cyclobacterium qasimii TaxID=1350429 RepID=S7WQK9_9BACT|nr:DUF4199 domain-containing protein [Cyclobacterium qasimii]EPR69034.1 hypothetical protein ADICYQ_1943 [Cyclobacterium qasimii M12-11B]GEO24199.1 hypothetical protein CQA01_47330 [Cyclobacterium qasimii]